VVISDPHKLIERVLRLIQTNKDLISGSAVRLDLAQTRMRAAVERIDGSDGSAEALSIHDDSPQF
jgi:hypothetical protein